MQTISFAACSVQMCNSAEIVEKSWKPGNSKYLYAVQNTNGCMCPNGTMKNTEK
jgi:hypothetical protein